MVRLSLEISGDKQLARDLLRFSTRLEDLSPAFQLVADDFYQLEREQFDSQGQRSSGGWAPLAPSTVAQKARRGLDPRILRATGTLYASLTSPSGPGAVREIGPLSMRIGTTVPYAGFHQQGTHRMPQRRPVELTEEDRRRWTKLLQRYIVETERGTGDAAA